jgi:hypothetical protein
MRNEKFTVYAILICIGCLGTCLSLSGCINLGTVPPVANGHVYLDGKVVSGATVEAVSTNGTNRQSTVTDRNGAYTLNITPATTYNITATYQGLRHTIWPVYLDNKTDTFNITLTTVPRSTIEGTGHLIIHNVPTNLSNYYINAMSTKDNTTISTIIKSDGSYSLEVEPNVLYNMNCTHITSPNPVAQFYYRNDAQGLGDTVQIMVGPNETALVDYVIPLP